MTIRVAAVADLEHMVHLSEAYRISLTSHSPTFWRKAEGSFEAQLGWFRVLLSLDDTLALVALVDTEIKGFVIGRLQEAPPVFAPGGPVCIIDDFCVASDSEWASVGSALHKS